MSRRHYLCTVCGERTQNRAGRCERCVGHVDSPDGWRPRAATLVGVPAALLPFALRATLEGVEALAMLCGVVAVASSTYTLWFDARRPTRRALPPVIAILLLGLLDIGLAAS